MDFEYPNSTPTQYVLLPEKMRRPRDQPPIVELKNKTFETAKMFDYLKTTWH
jgi:hypothetical protein